MVEITSSTISSLYKNESVTTNLVSNNFLPLILLGEMDPYSTDFRNFTRTYYKPSHERGIRVKSTSSKNILRTLNYSQSLDKYTFGSQSYFIGKGFVLNSTGEILIAMCFKKEYLKVEDEHFKTFSSHREDFDIDKFLVLVSSELVSKPEHSVFYRRLSKIYLSYCYEKGMEVRIVPSSVIEKNTFAKTYELRFNSITELDYHLRNEVMHIFRRDENEAIDSSFHIDIPPLINVVETTPVAEVSGELYFDQSFINSSNISHSNNYIGNANGYRLESYEEVNIQPSTPAFVNEIQDLIQSEETDPDIVVI